jgi:hypothetical protein
VLIVSQGSAAIALPTNAINVSRPTFISTSLNRCA